MAPERAVSAQHVRDVILKDLDRRAGRDGAWEVEFVSRGRESWLFKARSPQAPWPLAVKVYCTAVPKTLPMRQITALQHYHSAMSEPGLAVPAPFAAVPQHRTLIMEWIDAPRVDGLLRRAGRGEERNRIMAEAGRWLRHFHDLGEKALRPLGSIDLLRPLDTVLSGVGGVGARDRAFRTAYGVLQASTREFADRKLAFVTSHGDFSPANLFQGDGRTIGFDFKASTALPAARDMLHFLVYARSFNTSTWTLLTSDVDRADLDAFLGGYGPLVPAMDERLLSVFRLAEALYSWALLIDRIGGEGTNVRRLARIMRLRAMARHAARDLERD